jgi:hypothetical protein
MIQSATAFAEAAAESKLEAIVGLSQWLASPSHPSLLTRQHWLTDRMFSRLPNIAHITINPGYFADNYIGPVIGLVSQLGILPWPYGDTRNSPPSNEDIARVSVAALREPERHTGRTYRPTGPELLSAQEMATIAGRVFKRRITVMAMPIGMFLMAMRAMRRPRYEQLNVRHYAKEHHLGTWEFNAPTDHVLEVTGKQPEPFETTVCRYAALPDAQRTFANWARAFAEFMRIGMTLPPDLDRFEREQGYPVPSNPRFAQADPRWKKEHSPAFLKVAGVRPYFDPVATGRIGSGKPESYRGGAVG